jgi:hypothetical protein
MKVNNLIVSMLLIVGFGVGAISLYTSSLSGVMTKMGLYGGDFSQALNFNQLARDLGPMQSGVKCNTWEIAKHIPDYLFSTGMDRVNLTSELGNERIVCGVRLVQDGNIERGVYTIIKGMHYLRTHYSELRMLVESDRANCKSNVDLKFDRWIESYLNATQGRIHDIVYDLYKQVEVARASVDELCTN